MRALKELMTSHMTELSSGSKNGKRAGLVVIIAIISLGSMLLGYYAGIFQSAQPSQATEPLTLADVLSVVRESVQGGTVNPQLFEEVWNTISERYVNGPVDQKALFYGAIRGLVAGLEDPYSRFLDPEETEVFNQELSGSFEGIGTEIGIKDDQLTIIAPLPNSPAAAAGLQPGDRILAIDGVDTVGMAIDTAVNRIRGEKGTEVTLIIRSADEPESREVTIIRDVIIVESVSWSMLDTSIAYVEINHFDSDTDENFRTIAQEIVLKNPQGLIIDVRNNPGGFLDSVVTVTGTFFSNNELVVIEASGSERKEYHAESQPIFADIPTVVLVNQGSASASEIFAGALQDHDRATIVGEQTFGKGSVQDYEQFSDGSSLKLTVSKWLTPLGNSIDVHGITPDIEVVLTDDDYNNDRDPQLDRAIELLTQ